MRFRGGGCRTRTLFLSLNEKSARAAGGTQCVVALHWAMWFVLNRTGCLAQAQRKGEREKERGERGARGVETV